MMLYFWTTWEQRKLCDIADKVTTKNKDAQYVETFTNSAELGIISQRDFFDHDVSNKDNISGYYVVDDDAFVYNPRISTSAPVGPINRNKLGRTGVMSPLYTVFKIHTVDSEYLEWFFKSTRWHSFMKFNGDSGARSDRFSIKDAVFFEMPIPIPDIEEQRKIGKYLSTLNHLITLHQRKSFYNISNINVWEQRKLGSLLKETRNKTIVENEDTLLSCAIDGMYLNSELFSHFRGSSNIGYLKVKKNDLILSAQNLHLGNCNVNLRFEHGIISPAYKVYELVGCNPLFMQAWVKKGSTKDFFLKASTEGASVCRKNIVWEELYKQELPVPSIEEQVKVGDYFSNLDHLITLHRRAYHHIKRRTYKC